MHKSLLFGPKVHELTFLKITILITHFFPKYEKVEDKEKFFFSNAVKHLSTFVHKYLLDGFYLYKLLSKENFSFSQIEKKKKKKKE